MDTCIVHGVLLQYQDGELGPDECARIEKHLAHCQGCRQRVRVLMGLEQLLPAFVGPERPTREGCPEASFLAALAEGGLPVAEREQVIGHVADCERCAGALASLGRELAAAGDEPPVKIPSWVRDRAYAIGAGEAEPVAAARAQLASRADPFAAIARLVGRLRITPAVSLVAATALVLVMVLAGPRPDDLGSRRGGVRGVAPVPVTLVAPAEGAVFAGDSVLLGWQAVRGAVDYTVTVVDETGSFFWQRSTDGTSIRVPITDSWERGLGYSWWVDVLLASGRRLESPHRSFRLAGQP